MLKNLFDEEKLASLSGTKQAAIILLKNKIKKDIDLFIIFGSSIAGTSNEKSDIDVLIVTNNLNKIQKERKAVEELFGERFNLHIYTKDEIEKKINADTFAQNAFIKGAVLHGYDFGRELFSNIMGKKELSRVFFLTERIKSALRNYLNKDYKAAEEIFKQTLEQLIFYLLSERKIQYASKKDAKKLIEKIPEGKIIQKINKASLKEKLAIAEKLIMDILKQRILEEG